jgi:hypothetical protein
VEYAGASIQEMLAENPAAQSIHFDFKEFD